MHVFACEWLSQLRAWYERRREYQRPLIYRVATTANYQRLRAEVEEWVPQLPKGNQKNFIARLREDEHCLETYHELVVWNILRARGFIPEYEKPIHDVTPDWYVPAKGNIPAFIVEVLTKNPSDKKSARQRQIKDLRGRIEQIPVGASIGFDLYRAQCDFSPPNNKKIAVDLKRWLETENPPVGAAICLEGMTFSVLDRTTALSTVQTCYAEADRVDVSSLSHQIDKKVDRYKDAAVAARLPFVVALVADFFTGLTLHSLLSVLYGARALDEVLGKFPRQILESPPAKTNDGLFWRAPALTAAAWIDRDISGQWMMIAYHNPTAANPLAIDAFGGV